MGRLLPHRGLQIKDKLANNPDSPLTKQGELIAVFHLVTFVLGQILLLGFSAREVDNRAISDNLNFLTTFIMLG